MKILLLEDELMLNSAISEYLKNIGHMVESFFDGAEVLKSIENGYDLLILDVNVPNIDGFSILNADLKVKLNALASPEIIF